MKQELYTWKQVKAYTIIAIHNLLHSGNEISLKNVEMFIDPLRTLHIKDTVVEYSDKLFNTEKNNLSNVKK